MGRTLTDETISDFRARLCLTAEALLAEGGPSAVGMRAVAARLGISPMTPYRYFESKQAMIDAVRVRGFERLAEAVEQVRPGPTSEAGQRLAEVYVAFASERPALYRLMFGFGVAAEVANPAVAMAVDRARAAISRHVESFSREESGCTADTRPLGDLFWATLHGVLTLQLAGKLPHGAELRAAAVTAMTRGLTASRVERC